MKQLVTITGPFSLRVWQTSHQITLTIFQVTRNFPSEERFGLVSQMRRASASIGSNICEGFGRKSKREKQYFLDISIGSNYELQNHLILVHDVGLITTEVYTSLQKEVVHLCKQLNALKTSIHKKHPN